MDQIKEQVFLDFRDIYKTGNFQKWCSYISLRNKDTGRVFQFSPENWYHEQRTFEANRTGKKDIILKSRQVGMTTQELARDLFYAFRHTKSITVIVAHNQTLAKEIMDQLQQMYRCFWNLRKRTGVALVCPRLHKDNVKTMKFGEGIDSTITVMIAGNTEKQADTLRGFSTARLHITEMAQWAYGDITLSNLLKTTTPESEIVIESTPNGTDNVFYDYCQKAQQPHLKFPWKLHFFPWFLNEAKRLDLSPGETIVPTGEWEQTLVSKYNLKEDQVKFWREEVLENNIDTTLREYPIDPESCFRSAQDNFLDFDTLQYISSITRDAPSTERIEGNQLHIYEGPKGGEKYVIGADVASGRNKTNQDWSVLYVLSERTCQVVAWWEAKDVVPMDFASVLYTVAKRYNNALLCPENNNHGISTIETLEKILKYSNVYNDGQGFRTTQGSRDQVIDAVSNALKHRYFDHIPSVLAKTFKDITYNKKGKLAAHKSKTHDDHLIALGLALLSVRSKQAEHWSGIASDLFQGVGRKSEVLRPVQNAWESGVLFSRVDDMKAYDNWLTKKSRKQTLF